MASHEDVEFSKLGSFRKYLSDDSIYRNNVSSRKFPPDKMSFLATRPYLMPIIIWFLILSFYNKDSIQNCVTEGHLKVPEDSFYTFAESDHYMFYYKSPSVAEDHFDDSDTYVLSHTFDKLLKYSYQCLCEIQQLHIFAVLWSSSANVVPEKISTSDQFHSYTISPSCPLHVPFKCWTSDLDLLNPPPRSPLTQLNTPVIDAQMRPISIHSS